MKLRQLASNMTEIDTDTARILVSYTTPVACVIFGQGFYRTTTFHSRTTSKHINRWLDGAKAAPIDQGALDTMLRIV